MPMSAILKDFKTCKSHEQGDVPCIHCSLEQLLSCGKQTNKKAVLFVHFRTATSMLTYKSSFLFIYLHCGVGIGRWVYLPLLECGGQRTDVGIWFFPSKMWFWALTLCHQLWQQWPLPTEPSCGAPCLIFKAIVRYHMLSRNTYHKNTKTTLPLSYIRKIKKSL